MTTLQKKPTAGASPGRRRESGGSWPARFHVIRAVFDRNFQAYFSNPAGYVFITLFVLLGAWAAFWRPEFFANNLANLGTLNDLMPYLLLFFIPAITMSAWAEERRQGTDELLLTLPAHDIEVVLGKYLAALGIFTVALLFSLSHVLILWWLGRPDPGIMAATFLGYWLMGVLMIAVGMVASLLSSNVTVGFILGAVFNAIPVFAGLIAQAFGPTVRHSIEEISIPSQFREFGAGEIPASGVFYFVSAAAAMLYLNMILIGRRHWAGGERSRSLAGHSLARVVALVLALIGLDLLVSRQGWVTDASAEQLFALSPESRAVINQIPGDRPVYIQAFYSTEVPRENIQTRDTLIGKLREYAAIGGDKIRLNLVPTELYSTAAREAQKRFGIEPKRVVSVEEARQSASEIFLGVAFTSGLEEVVVPFFDPGLPVEYELTRSIRVVSKEKRKKAGVLATDAKMLGGFDFRSMGQETEWPFVTELKKQYDVSSIALDAPIPNDLDVLLVAQPSSMTQKQIDALTDYVRAGHPTLLFLDPLPYINPSLATEVPKAPAGGPFGGGPPPEPKGNMAPLLDLLGIEAPGGEIVWNTYNPLLNLPELPPEFVFVGKGSGGADAFNPAEPASSGLQEMVLMFPGLLNSKGTGPKFTPLLQVSGIGGTIPFAETVQQSFMGVGGINPNRRHVPTNLTYTLAARIEGKPAADPAAKPDAKPPAEIKAIAIADLDMISEQFFEIRRRKIDNLDFDKCPLRAQLRGRPRRRRRLHRPPQAPGPAPDPGAARGADQRVRQGRPDRGQAGRGRGPRRPRPGPEVARREGPQDPRGQGARRPRPRDQAPDAGDRREPPAGGREGRHRGREAAQAPGLQGQPRAGDPPDRGPRPHPRHPRRPLARPDPRRHRLRRPIGPREPRGQSEPACVKKERSAVSGQRSARRMSPDLVWLIADR